MESLAAPSDREGSTQVDPVIQLLTNRRYQTILLHLPNLTEELKISPLLPYLGIIVMAGSVA
jgi:hypothetical protein